MTQFHKGQDVGVPCDVQPGPFPDEFLVTIQTDKDVVSGFVNSRDLKKVGESRGYVRAAVVDVTEETVTVRIAGSFFTTTGLASVSPAWATSHLEAGAVA